MTDDPPGRPGAPNLSGSDGDPADGVLRISCDDCVARHTDACADCVVSFLCNREADDAVVIAVAEARALRLLERGGLAPSLRHRTG
jgi:hypothetical protein